MSENLKEFIKLLENNVVDFEFRNKNGNIETATGTLQLEFLPSSEVVIFDKEVIDILMKEKNISSIDEYAKPNSLELYGETNDSYIFKFKRNKKSKITFFDVDKQIFRTINKSDFLSIKEIS